MRTQALFENLVMNDKPNLVVIGGDTVSPNISQNEVEYKARLHSILDFLIEG